MVLDHLIENMPCIFLQIRAKCDSFLRNNIVSAKEMQNAIFSPLC